MRHSLCSRKAGGERRQAGSSLQLDTGCAAAAATSLDP